MSCFVSSHDRDDVIRPLDSTERVMSAVHTLRIFNGVVISCRYSVPFDYKPDSLKERVERAIAGVVLANPVLCAGLVDDNSKKPAWVRLATLDLDFHVRWLDVDPVTAEGRDKAFREVIQPYLDLPFPDLETRPAWSITVLKPAGSFGWIEVVFAFSHLLSDAVGGRIFHEQLLQHLRSKDQQPNGLALNGGVLKLPSWTSETFTPAPEQLIRFTYSPCWTAAFLARELLPSVLFPKSDMRWMRTCSDKPCLSRWLVFTIQAPEAARLIATCRQNKTTLTGLIHAATLIAFCARLPENKAKVFVGETPINLRRFAEHKMIDPDKTMMSVVTLCSHRFDSVVGRIRASIAQGKAATVTNAADDLTRLVWEVAAGVRAQLAQRLEQGTRNDPVGLVKFVGDTLAFFRREMKQPRRSIWEISNMGVISNEPQDLAPRSEKDDWSIEGCVFLQGILDTSAGYDIGLAGVKGGPITVYCVWGKGLIPDELGYAVSSHIEAIVMELATCGKLTSDILGTL